MIPLATTALLVAAGFSVLSAPAAHAAACPTSVGGGASVAFTTYEAECAATNGTTIGPDYTQASLASEASGRQAVRLTSGQYVEFTLTSNANAINVHYSVPDGASGQLSVYVNGNRLGLPVTSRYSYIETPWIPGAKQHHFYDDTRALLGQDLGAGAKVRVQAESEITVDLADFEQVAGPGGRPANSVAVTDYGATANDGSDDANAFRAGLSAARSQGKELWVPPGRFEIGSALGIDQTTVRGAGAWHTVLHGNNVFKNDGQVSGNIRLHDFAVFGDVTERRDEQPENGFHGVLGAGSVVSGLWIQNTKCGLWLMNGATSNLTIENNRILDTMADGVNFDGNVTNSAIRNNYLRNTGDDGLALWSNGIADAGISIVNNTVVQPNLANGIALYGGRDNSVRGNLVRDTNALGGGITVANRFQSVPLAGTITLADNTLLRTGALDPNWQFGVGAVWFDAREQAITGVQINVTNLRAIESPYEVFQFIDGNGQGKPIQGVSINGVTVQGAGTFVAQAQTQGSVNISNLSASGVGVTGTYNCPYPTNISPMSFSGSGNSGWTGTWSDCSTWPKPNTGDPGPQPGGNLAKGRPASASSSVGGFPAGNAVDGNANTYWESNNGAFPQTLTVDLGSATSVSKVVLKLPPSSAWGTRTQTLSVLGSVDGGGYSTLVGSRGVTFDPASGNTATLTFGATSQRYLRLNITGNTGWPAGQAAEFEVYA